MQTLKDYQHLICSTITTEIVVQERIAIIQLQRHTERDTPGRHPMELGITALLSLWRHQLGQDWSPVSVHFTHAPPASSAHHRRVLGCDTVFASDFDGIVVSNQDLQRLDPEHDSRMEGHARQLIDVHAPRSVEQQVHSTLQSLLPHGRHSIAQVAGALGCTSRSLQRQRENSQTSFQETLDAVRRQAAIRALKNPQLCVSEAAALSGFMENSSFTRWFSKHFQQSPSAWRQQQLSRPL